MRGCMSGNEIELLKQVVIGSTHSSLNVVQVPRQKTSDYLRRCIIFTNNIVTQKQF